MLFDSVDIYRFDDGWRWVRLVSMRPIWPGSKPGSPFHHPIFFDGISGVTIAIDPKRYIYLVLMDPNDKSWALFRSKFYEETIHIFEMVLYSSGILWEADHEGGGPVKEGLVARAWPLGTELHADVEEVQNTMADNAIKLPMVLPDRVWERMAEAEPQIVTEKDALAALRHAFADLATITTAPVDPYEGSRHIVNINVLPSFSLQVFFGDAPREWALNYEDGATGRYGRGRTFVEALNGAAPAYGGPLLKKSEFDALWDAIVVPGEAMFDPEPYFLLDAPHPAFLPLDTFLALAREEGLI